MKGNGAGFLGFDFFDWFHRKSFATLNRKLDRIMADISGLQAAAAQIQTDVQEAITALDDLASKVAAGDSVAQADIDAITESLRSAGQSLDDAVAADDPADPPVDQPDGPPAEA